MKLFTPALCATLSVFAFTSTSLHAQVMTSREIDRGLTYPGPINNGFVGPVERYNYQTPSFIYLGGDRNRMLYLDYLDRADRAAKFGYCMPVDPFFPPTPPIASFPPAPAPAADFPPAPQPAPGSYLIGAGWGIFRRR